MSRTYLTNPPTPPFFKGGPRGDFLGGHPSVVHDMSSSLVGSLTARSAAFCLLTFAFFLAAASGGGCGRAGSHDSVRPLPVPTVIVDDSSSGKGGVGIGASLKFDARGMPHISYYDVDGKALKYIYFAKTAEGAGKWVPTVVFPEYDTAGVPTGGTRTEKGTFVDKGTKSDGDGMGKWNALNVDPSGRPHIVYYDDDNKQIKYAWGSNKRKDGVWEFKIVTLDSESRDVGQWISAALDESGSIHVAYVSFDASRKGAVKYLRWDRQRPDDGGEWDPASEDGDKPPVPGVFLDPNQFARGDDPSKTSIALSAPDAEHQPDTVYIVYYDPNREGGGQPNGDLRLAQKPVVGGEWEITTIDDLRPSPQSPGDGTPSDVGRWASVTVDHRGRLHISYTDALAGDLKYIVYDSNLKRWYPRFRRIKNFDRGTLQVREEVAPVADDQPANLVLVSEENLSEFSQAEGEVLLEEWVGQIVEDGIDPGTGLESTIAMGPNQRPLISYRDGATGDLKLAIQVSDPGAPEAFSWTIQSVDTPKIVGLWSSMASFTYSESALEGWVIGIAYEGFDQMPDSSLQRRLLLRLINPFVTDVF